MKKFLALALVFLAACQEAPPSARFDPIHVTGGTYRLDVAEIRFENNAPADNVASQFPVPPAEALKQWSNDHLVAAGSNGFAIFSINDVSVKETKLPKKKGVEGYFTDQQDARYDAHVAATIRIYTGGAMSVAEVSAEAAQSRSINEGATLLQREQFYYDLTRELTGRFGGAMEPQISRYFGNYLK